MRTPLLRSAALFAAGSIITISVGCKSSAPSAAAATAPVKMSQLAKDQPKDLSVTSATAPVTVPGTLQFSNQSIKAIQAGTKLATVRKGVRSFPTGVIKAVSGANEPLILQNVTTTTKKLSDLTEGDAKANGSDSLDELKADLSRDYPGIEPDDVVTVIAFRLAAADSSR